MAGPREPLDGGTQDNRPHAGRRLLHAFVSANSYGLVLVLVVVTYVVSVSSAAGWAQSVVLTIQILTVWLTFRTAGVSSSAGLFLVAVFLAVGAVATANLFIAVNSKARAVAVVVGALLYLAAPFLVLRDIGGRRKIDQETVLGAIAAYLFVGMFFAFTYRAIGILQPTPFFGAGGRGDMSQVLFFSFVTLTTTGYGDLVPAGNPGQTLAVMEAVLGQLFLVTAVAKIITAWRPRQWRHSGEPD